MRSIKTSIIIVNWKSKDFLRSCLRSLEVHEPGREHEIIVVDSGSFDGCGEMLATEFPYVRFFQSTENVGFGQANNLGAQHARGSVIALLNPDTELIQPAIAPLVAHLEGLPRAGIVGCKLLNTDRSLQVACVQPFPTVLNQAFNSLSMQRRYPRLSLWTSAITFDGEGQPVAVDAVIGACMVMQKALFESVGGFSADYFMYAEDIDLCYSVHSRGLANYYAPDIQLIHHGGGSTKTEHSRFSSVLMRQSVMKLLQRRRGYGYGFAYRVAMVLSATARLAVLAVWLPIAISRRRLNVWRAACGKWVAILRWGLGLETWIHQFEPMAGNGVRTRSA